MKNASHRGTVVILRNTVKYGSQSFFTPLESRPGYPAEPFQPTATGWQVERFRRPDGAGAQDRYSFPNFMPTLARLAGC